MASDTEEQAKCSTKHLTTRSVAKKWLQFFLVTLVYLLAFPGSIIRHLGHRRRGRQAGPQPDPVSPIVPPARGPHNGDPCSFSEGKSVSEVSRALGKCERREETGFLRQEHGMLGCKPYSDAET